MAINGSAGATKHIMNEETLQQSSSSQDSMEMIRYKEGIAKEMGLPSPFGMALLKKVCEDMIASGLVPQCFAKNPMAVYAAALRGREMGLSTSESIFETFWAAPGGRLGIYSAKMLDLMHRGQVVTEYVEFTRHRCEMIFTPLPPFRPITVSFEFSEAVDAGLAKPDSNWKKWPADMCKARCVSRAWRMLLGAFKGGANLYSKEELEDVSSDRAATIEQERTAEKETMAQFSPGRRGPGRPRKDQPSTDAISPVVAGSIMAHLDQQEEKLQAPSAERYGVYYVEGGRIGIVPGHDNHSRSAAESLASDWAKSMKPRPMSYAVLQYDTQREVFRAEPPKPESVELMSPANALYFAIGCNSREEFDIYRQATGLDKLTGEEHDAFCLLASKLIDAKGICKIHERGVSYASIISVLQEVCKGTIASQSREVLAGHVNSLLEASRDITPNSITGQGDLPWQ